MGSFIKDYNCEPLVSIIIPVYNAQQYLYRTIESTVNQSYKNIEIIIVNDGSSDKTEAIVKGFTDNRITYIRQDNKGVSQARNSGLVSSNGKYVLFLDADDILQNDFIKKRVNYLESNLEYALCCSRLIKIDEKDNPIDGSYRGPSDNLLEEILLYNRDVITCPSLFLMRKDILKETKFNSSLFNSADRFFLLQIWADKNKCCLIDDDANAMLLYREHKASMSNNLNARLISDLIQFMHELNKLPSIPYSVKTRFLVKQYYIIALSYLKIGRIIQAGYYGILFILARLRAAKK